MAIGWLALLKTVPWVDVVRNSPKIADEAKKLWSTITNKPNAESELEANRYKLSSGLSSENNTVESLQKRLATVESACANLHNQMLASTELIQALAEQNAQLIKKIELSRVRILRLIGVGAVIGLIAIFNLIYTFAK
ncbi:MULTISPECIES: hypothetical protein [Methylotenera]|uniref:hypothetical protein n=1 Tax=Methylotenera TaxID=359407 RepID=UPI00036BD607|nr:MULTISPECIES: hypothetical protein [Methylotenera]